MNSLNRELVLPHNEGLILTPRSLDGLFALLNVKFIRTPEAIAVFRDYITHDGGAALFGIPPAQVVDGGFIHAIPNLPDYALIRVLGTTDTIRLPANPNRRGETIEAIQTIVAQATYPQAIEVERADIRPLW